MYKRYKINTKMKRILNKTEQNKIKFLEALRKNLNIVSAAVDSTGIGRTTFYEWLKNDPEFKKKVDEIPEFQMDFVENALLKRIKDGSDTAITFYLRTKGKKRGYDTSTSNINVEGKIDISISDLIDFKNKEDEDEDNIE